MKEYILSPQAGVALNAYGPFVCFAKAKEYAVNNGLVATHIPLKLTTPKE